MKSESEVDPVLRYIGSFGRWQAIFIWAIMSTYLVVLATWQMLVMTFHVLPTDFFCKPIVESNDTEIYDGYNYDDWMSELNGMAPAQCEVSTYTPGANLTVHEDEKCHDWIYDLSFYPRTIVTDVSEPFHSQGCCVRK